MEFILKNNDKEDTKVIAGTNALDGLKNIASGYTKVVLITDKGAESNCLGPVRPYLPEGIDTIVIEGGEGGKDLDSSKEILDKLQTLGCDRGSLVIGLGGGVVNDIVGFVASIYMRGIDWVMLPTTLTAQADASIGGKTGVNLGQYKNMVGSFWPPKAVLVNPDFLKTLPENHLKNGLAEIIKMGFIADTLILSHIEQIDPENVLGEQLDKASGLAVKAKVEIVNNDLRESGERKLLNFGHTIGHAIETLSLKNDRSLLHGEAISIGMVAESKLAELEGVAEAGLNDQIKETLGKFGLPVAYSANTEDILKIIASDKKNVSRRINWTLPETAGKGIFDYVADPKNIEQAIKSVI